jgi:hypothetical protein
MYVLFASFCTSKLVLSEGAKAESLSLAEFLFQARLVPNH